MAKRKAPTKQVSENAIRKLACQWTQRARNARILEDFDRATTYEALASEMLGLLKATRSKRK